MEYQIDSMNKLILRPQISYNNSNYTQTNDYTYDRDSIRINDGYQNQTSLQEEISASLRAIYNHKFSRPGRALTMRANISFKNTKGETDTYAWDRMTSTALVDQYTLSGNNTMSYSLRTSYVEPIYGKNHFLETVLSLSGNNRNSVKDQYSKDSITGDYQYDNTSTTDG